MVFFISYVEKNSKEKIPPKINQYNDENFLTIRMK